ncbi:epidermal growth factor-like protein 7 isoform 5-T11 [Dugong dugon]
MGAPAHGLGGRARHTGPMPHRGSGATPAQRGSGGRGRAWAWAASGHPENKAGPPARWPCGAPGSCSWCGSWCWPRVAQTTSTGLAEECAQSGLPGVRFLSPLCSGCTSHSSPPATGTGPAAPTGSSTGLPTAAVLGQPQPECATPAVLAGKGPVGSLGPVEQQYASHHARMEGAVSSQADVTALPGGRGIPARQMWMSVAGDEAAVTSTVSTLQAATGASVGRGTACPQTGHSACP